MATNTNPTLGNLIDQVTASTDDPLVQLEKAVHTAGDLSTLGDQLVGHFVDVARGAGLSWAQIGRALGGVSKQAAQQRFSFDVASLSKRPDFSHFTERAKAALSAAQTAAEQHRHSYIGTEHVLLGLCADPDSLAAKALAELAGSLDRVRESTEAKLGDPSPVTAKPRYTLRARAALEQTLAEAINLGHNYIGTEHMLLGLLATANYEGGGQPLAAQILNHLGVGYDGARESLVKLLGGYTKK
jgi:ClpA/ClpB-like protein